MKLKAIKTCYLLLLLFSFFLCTAVSAQDDLDNYIERLKKSQASGGKETAFMSAGSDFLYGQGYFDSKQYDLAAMYFKYCVDKEPENPFFNYQYAVALINQKDKYKAQQAQPFLEKAFTLNPSLKNRFEKGLPNKPAESNQQQGNNAQPQPVAFQSLDGYLEKLRYARATGGKETAMNTVGRDVMYGYDYYERGEYQSAATNFRLAVSGDPENIYANYLLGVSLSAQGMDKEAAPYLNKAFAGDSNLKSQFRKDAAHATAQHQKYEDTRRVKYTPAVKKVIGGALVFGKYVCNETVWNGPNASPAYRFVGKGYFELKPDGTYRWLDNGRTGRYTYDAATGTVRWLSGHFAAAPPKSQYSPGENYAQITLNFSESYRWECACKKK